MQRLFFRVGLIFFIVCVDQLTKWWASKLSLVYLNQGIAFGWNLNIESGWFQLIILSSLILLSWLWRRQTRYDWGLTLMIAGGISNLIDRLVWGGVKDFIPMIWWHNNLADWAISIGLLLIVRQIFIQNFLNKK